MLKNLSILNSCILPAAFITEICIFALNSFKVAPMYSRSVCV